ncbi:hypothetical protein [Vagococcus xieshaowenii]|uniref:Uncharacterized protein n=1 Tax=Vagococcus xieshaowenii TaxID=2562451 RepID=A0AAJ5EFL5_9ENTE|nr:hypothetical protein [Vagococcus xieshaowenii]QCA28265.1 hypothetical protein E4Z98_02645 [Vagococcus xieshaowenii]TFZ41920.1 hypothetical protein E4031_04825 [Vagococcus xieshaowenii]
MEKIYRGMQNGAETINANFEEIGGLKVITPTLETGFTKFSDGQAPRLLIVGRSVELQGAIKNSSIIKAGSSITVGTIPKEYAPKGMKDTVNQASSNFEFNLTVDYTGAIKVSRYRDSGFVDMGVDTWITLSSNWLIG